MTLNEYFTEEKLDFLENTQLDSAKYYRETGRVELYCTVSAALLKEQELHIKKLFANKIGVSPDSVKLILKNKNPLKFDPQKLSEYTSSLRSRLHEKGLRTCEYALNNIAFVPPSKLVVEAVSNIDLQVLERRNADKIIAEWFLENFDIDFQVELRLNDMSLAEIISHHRDQRDEEVKKAIKQRTAAAAAPQQ
ncbi:MAG: hypothetical protein J6L92_06935, partial [Clostridia bacterium]|nr:hypothetical protein [Clostridia bacterium]